MVLAPVASSMSHLESVGFRFEAWVVTQESVFFSQFYCIVSFVRQRYEKCCLYNPRLTKNLKGCFLDNVSKGLRRVSKFVEKNLITVSLLLGLGWLLLLVWFSHRKDWVPHLDNVLYLIFWQDRLIALDAAEEFFKIACRTYPKKPGMPSLADGRKELHYLPFPSP